MNESNKKSIDNYQPYTTLALHVFTFDSVNHAVYVIKTLQVNVTQLNTFNVITSFMN